MSTLLLNSTIAREHGHYAAILYAFLQEKQEEYNNYSDIYNTRQGKKWIVALSFQSICQEMTLFSDVKTVKLAAEALRKAALILTESTGKYLEEDHITGRKRDIATWWHVIYKAASIEDLIELDTDEAEEHGIPQALILACCRMPKEMKDGYSKLSPVELERVLPMDERTARRHLKAMLKAGFISQHPTKKKLYKLLVKPTKPVFHARIIREIPAKDIVVECPVIAQKAA